VTPNIRPTRSTQSARRHGGGIWASTLALLVSFASTSHAQIPRPSWGVAGGVTPIWKVTDYQHQLFGATAVGMSGREFSIGLVRGELYRGDWGVSFVQRTIKAGGFVTRMSGGQSVTTTIGSAGQLRGAVFQKFIPFVTINDRVQIGVIVGGGGGVFRGHATRTTGGGPAEPAEPKDLFVVGGSAWPFVPIGIAEVAGTFVLTDRLKIRASGGLDFPGHRVVNLTAVFFFKRR
jgi:hypothetical protein